MTLRTRSLAALLTVPLALAACSGSSSEEDATSATSTTTTDEGGSAPSSSGEDEVAEAARVAGVDPANPPKPIASTTVPAAGDGKEVKATTMRVDLISLRRQDRLLVLTVAFTPEGEGGKAATYYTWMGSGATYSPHLVDATNLKKHEVVVAKGYTMTDTGPLAVKFAPGQTFYAYAVFAAPPEDVTTMTVHTADGAAPFTDVKIQ